MDLFAAKYKTESQFRLGDPSLYGRWGFTVQPRDAILLLLSREEGGIDRSTLGKGGFRCIFFVLIGMAFSRDGIYTVFKTEKQLLLNRFSPFCYAQLALVILTFVPLLIKWSRLLLIVQLE